MGRPQEVLEFWFGSNPNDAAVAEERASLWWSKNDETDAEVCRRFESLVISAEQGGLQEWLSTPEGRLALIIVTDQLPRNIYRGSASAFRFDDIARTACLQGLIPRCDRLLRPIHRVFFYLPLEHSENLDDQHRCVQLFQELLQGVSEHLRPTFEGYVDFALRHQVIVQRFGRFPHRNAILGRESTAEELQFLKEPGSSF